MKLYRSGFYFVLSSALTLTASALDFRLINWEGSDNEIQFSNAGKSVPVLATERSLSPVYQFSGAGPLVLFKETQKDGKTVREEIASLPIPAGMTHGILILAATDGARKTYSGVWVDDAPTTRPARTIKVLNMSRYPVAFRLDKDDFTLRPTETHQTLFSADAERLAVQAAAQVGEKWQSIGGNPLPVRSRVRLLILLRDGRPEAGRATNIVDFQSFYDIPPPLPGTPTAPGTKVANISR